MFTPIWGRFPICLTNVYQMGWFNHQLVSAMCLFSCPFESSYHFFRVQGLCRHFSLQFPRSHIPSDRSRERHFWVADFPAFPQRCMGYGGWTVPKEGGLLNERDMFFPHVFCCAWNPTLLDNMTLRSLYLSLRCCQMSRMQGYQGFAIVRFRGDLFTDA